MCTTKVLSILLVCFVFCGLTSSKPPQPTSETTAEKWNQELSLLKRRTYAGYLISALAAASAGRNFFEQPEPVTEDCVRTARVTMNLLTQPSTLIKTQNLLGELVPKTIATSNQNLIEIMCKNLNEVVKQNQSDFPDFEELKKKVELPHPFKKYFLEIPQQTTAVEFMEKPMYIDIDPELIKLEMMITFFSQKYFKSARAIHQLLKNGALKSTVDSVFAKARDDYLKDLLTKSTDENKTKFIFGENKHEDFAKTLNEYFLKNPLLKEEYKKLIEKQ